MDFMRFPYIIDKLQARTWVAFNHICGFRNVNQTGLFLSQRLAFLYLLSVFWIDFTTSMNLKKIPNNSNK